MVRIVRKLIDNNDKVDIFAIGLAGWILFNSGNDENSQSLEISDPIQDRYKSIYENNSTIEKIVKSFVNLKEVFPEQLISNSDLVNKIIHYIKEIKSKSILEVISKI